MRDYIKQQEKFERLNRTSVREQIRDITRPAWDLLPTWELPRPIDFDERERALTHAEKYDHVPGLPGGISWMTDPALMPRVRSCPEKRQADEFMKGLRRQAEELEEGLATDQEVQMYCFDGYQGMQVLEISMPSNNVVALRCIDADGNPTHLTQHMHSVRFTFVVHTLVPPQVYRPIRVQHVGSGVRHLGRDCHRLRRDHNNVWSEHRTRLHHDGHSFA